MTAARILLVLTGLVPMALWPIGGTTGTAAAADEKDRRVAVGEVVGEVVKVADGRITVKVTETMNMPARPRTVTFMHHPIVVPQHHTRTIHKDISYGLADDVAVKWVGAKAGTPDPGVKDLHAGDPVLVHLSRTTAPTGAPPADPVITRIDVKARPQK